MHMLHVPRKILSHNMIGAQRHKRTKDELGVSEGMVMDMGSKASKEG